jgi:sodium-dependent dicarboxylate transporter 2/3/5
MWQGLQKGENMSTQLTICLVISLLAVIGFIHGKLPLGTVGCAAMLAYLFTGCIDEKTALGTIGNSNIVMVSGMFVISAGLRKTQFVHLIGKSVKAISKGSMAKVMLGFILASILAATLTGSALAAFAIVIPIVSATCEEMNISISRAAFCVGLACIASCGIVPVGGTLAMLAEINGYIDANEYSQYQLALTDLFVGRWPVLVMLTLYSMFLGWKIAPEKPVIETSEFSLGSKGPAAPLAPFQEKCGYTIFFGVTLLLAFSGSINSFFKSVGIPAVSAWEIVLLGCLLLVLTKVLSPKECFGAVNWDMAFLIIGCLCMGAALNNTGAGTLIGNAIASVAGRMRNNYMIGAMFFIIPFLLTQIMQNRSVMAIFQPIAILACKSMGVSCVGPCILVAAACTTSFMTPMATACIPYIMEVGGYDVKSQFVQSLLPAVLLSVINVFYVMTVFPL